MCIYDSGDAAIGLFENLFFFFFFCDFEAFFRATVDVWRKLTFSIKINVQYSRWNQISNFSCGRLAQWHKALTPLISRLIFVTAKTNLEANNRTSSRLLSHYCAILNGCGNIYGTPWIGIYSSFCGKKQILYLKRGKRTRYASLAPTQDKCRECAIASLILLRK